MSRSQFFKCLNTIPARCTLVNEYPSSNKISKKNGMVRGDCIACNAFCSSDLPKFMEENKRSISKIIEY